MRWFPSMLVLAALASSPASAEAVPARRLAVLPVIIAGDARTSVSTVFDAVQAAGDLRLGLEVMTLDEYYSHEGAEIAESALACGQDTACMSQKLAPLSTDLGLVVVINRELDPPLLSVLLLDTQNRRVAAESYGQFKGGIDRIGNELERITAGFFDRLQIPKAGRLVVAVEPKGARLLIPGDYPSDRGQPNAFTVPPGTYEVVATLDGYRRSTAAAIVKSGETTAMALRLEPEGSLLSSPWFWVGTGAVVAVAATTIILLTRPTESCVCVITAQNNECMVCQ
jgi:hypothetical protein